MKVKLGKLAKQVMKELDGYGVEVGLEIEKIVDEVAEEAAKDLRREAPRLTGDYAEAWTYSTGDTKRTRYSKVIHAEKPQYAVSHLLEKGHQKRNGGRVEPQVHIEPVKQAAVKKLESEIRKRL